MFDRFTAAARQVVTTAQGEAQALEHNHIGTEHLLLGLLGAPDSPAGQALASFGVNAEAIRRQVVDRLSGVGLDEDALAAIGIDLDAVRNRVEDTFGPGALDSCPRHRPSLRLRPFNGYIPFTPRSKKVLELSLREARQLHHNYIGPEHVLLGLLREGRGLASAILTDGGVEASRIRDAVINRIQRTA